MKFIKAIFCLVFFVTTPTWTWGNAQPIFNYSCATLAKKLSDKPYILRFLLKFTREGWQVKPFGAPENATMSADFEKKGDKNIFSFMRVVDDIPKRQIFKYKLTFDSDF